MAQKVFEVMTPAPVALRPDQPLVDAAIQMRKHGIGDVLVADDGQLKGLITDRDIVVRGIADGKDPGSTLVAELCSEDLITVTPKDDASTAVRRMREAEVRRIPVVDEGNVVGVVSIGDMAIELDENSALADISAGRPNA
ncbi:MAG TPA: CBS domain-containing protein [Trebonia sp.]|nr:CBS domain-containing protein [Trebonia sp.]